MPTLSAKSITPIEPPVQFESPQFGALLTEASALIQAAAARDRYRVDGAGLTAAILDTGIRATHVDFSGRVVAQRNFTSDNGGAPDDAGDGNGHGTNVSGIVAAGQIHRGIAPGASLAALKVLSNAGGGTFQAVADALQWVLDNHQLFNITVVNLSLGDSRNLTSDGTIPLDDAVRQLTDRLRAARIAVVVAAGNGYFSVGSAQGMGYPAILPGTISVGAVYDAVVGPMSYSDGASAVTTGPDRITPFSQRLHESVNRLTKTDIFAPGAPVRSAGINNDTAESVQHGTSQASPVIAGVILLLQQFYKNVTGDLPTIDAVVDFLTAGSVAITDGDDEDDNVEPTGLVFRRVNALATLQAAERQLETHLFTTGMAFR